MNEKQKFMFVLALVIALGFSLCIYFSFISLSMALNNMGARLSNWLAIMLEGYWLIAGLPFILFFASWFYYRRDVETVGGKILRTTIVGCVLIFLGLSQLSFTTGPMGTIVQ